MDESTELLALPAPIGTFSVEQQRELESILEAVTCPVRQRILMTLTAAGRGDRGGCGSVGWLARQTNIAQTTISHHLSILRRLDIVFSRQRGKEHWYECPAGHVRYEYRPTEFSLAIARNRGLSLTITADHPPSAAAQAAAA